MTYEEAKLLPCPFCESAPEWINEALPDSHYYIRCPECHIVMKEDRRDKVIGLWNRRLYAESVKKEAIEKAWRNGYETGLDYLTTDFDSEERLTEYLKTVKL